MMINEQKYAFTWNLIGDIELGRPNLGQMVPLEIYRLALFTLRDVLEQQIGTPAADQIFYQAGKLAGKEFYRQKMSAEELDMLSFWRHLQVVLREANMGILRVEQANPIDGSFVITMAEDLDCSGLPDLDYETCTYDEGFLAALLEAFTGQPYQVKEVDCWCTGDRTCRFSATLAA